MIKIEELLINSVDYSDYVSIPLQTQDTLDESLDMAYIELKGLEIESPFVPFSNVYIKVSDSEHFKELYMQVESDEVTEIVPLKKYNHNLLIIEETKWLERFFIEKSITQPLIHDYTGTAKEITYASINNEATDNSSVIAFMQQNINFKDLLSPIKFGESINLQHIVFDEPSAIDWQFYSGTMSINKPNGDIENITIERDGLTTLYIDNIGTYQISYDYTLRASTGLSTEYAYYRFNIDILSINQTKYKPNKTVKDVLELLLETFEVLRDGEKPRFTLANIEEYKNSDEYKKQVQKVFNMTCPEMYFSKMSLFEALKTIGDFGHFIPRMKNKKIYLDLLGQQQITNIDLTEYMSHTSRQDTNNFCTKLDSQVNNLVNLDSDNQGSVVTPFNDGFKTFRMQTGIVQFTDDGIIIPTENPIEKIVKLEIGYLSDGTYVGDITPYVYESAEYDVLNSFDDDYPNAKMYALKYTQGSPNITQLSFRREHFLNPIFEDMAIKNIIYRHINRNKTWLDNILKSEDVFKLQYRLTYIPVTTARVTQSKVYKGNITKSVSIAYNQSASKTSSNAYGENLKGQILKMGNAEINKVYVLPSIDLIPECGKKFDNDYYISVVKCEYYPNFIKCELGLSKDFNNKSSFVEINSQLRFYEVSEKIAYDVYKIYEDYCEIGFDSLSDNNSLITDDGINKFRNSFYTGHADTNLTLVKAGSLDVNKNMFAQFALPIISLGLGNSLMFAFDYVGNYGAGSVAGYTNNTKIQQMSPYGDEYGEIPYLDLKYGTNTDKVELDGNIILSGEEIYKKASEIGDDIPLGKTINTMKVYFDTKDKPIKLLKDNREAIHFTYQIHFVANNNNIVIGSGLARYSSFVTNEELNYKLVLLKEKLNKFEDEIDLTNVYYYGSINMNVNYDNKKIKMENIVAPLDSEEWKAWAVVNEIKNADGETVKSILILGENKDIKSGDIVEMPNFVFKHKIVEE